MFHRVQQLLSNFECLSLGSLWYRPTDVSAAFVAEKQLPAAAENNVNERLNQNGRTTTTFNLRRAKVG